ncbi:MAG: hypothetical protein RLY78_3893 [Pseudomonadota bacterium]
MLTPPPAACRPRPVPRFIHTADIHLDSPLRGLSAYQDAPAERLRGASREAFSALVTRAIDERIDFIVIAGDLYDGDWPDFNTGLYFCAEMGRLQRAGIPAFVLHGNHDAESQMTRALRLPDNVRVFAANACQTHVIEPLRVALHGRSFRQAATTDNLVTGYAAPLRDHVNIGVLHTALEGHAEHPRYAPCTLAELQAKGYEYWALGHVHEHALWPGPSTICFPGNLQGRSVRECGPRGAVLVEIDGPGAQARVERLTIDVLRWEHLRLDVSGCADLAAVGLASGRALGRLLDVDGQVPRAVRLTLHGRTAAHGALFARATELRAQVLAEIAAIGPERLWLEKLRLETQPDQGPATDDGPLGADALADLAALLQEARDDAVLREALRTDFAQLLGKAPDLATELPLLRQVRDGELDAVFDQVLPGLIARLASAA